MVRLETFDSSEYSNGNGDSTTRRISVFTTALVPA